MKIVAKKILELLNNNHTEIEEKEDFKGNYYSYITDKIYLSTNKNENNEKEGKKNNITKETNSLVVMCHEAVHSVQSKTLHILNSIFSNLGILFSFVCLVLFVINKDNIVINMFTLIDLALAIIIRLILEIEAVAKSIDVAEKVLIQGVIENVKKEELMMAKEYINKNKFLALARMVFGKIILFLIILTITII